MGVPVSRLSRASVAALATMALVAGPAGAFTSAHAATTSSRHALAGSVPTWAKASARKGASATTTKVDFRVYLDWRGGTAAADYASAVSTPGSASYGKFLTPAQFKSRFSPTSTTVGSVKSWLRSQGFTVGHVPSNNKYVEAIGTVGQAAKAFGTSFSQYAVAGRTLRSNSTALTVPNTLTGVQAVLGLDQSARLVKHEGTPPPVFNNARPCSEYWGEKTVAGTPTPDGIALPSDPTTFAPCGYAGSQLQGAYGLSGAIDSGNDGTGVTVAVVDAYASPTMLADANEYSAAHGLPSLNGLYAEHVAPGTKIRGDNPAQDPSGWSGEESLDVEAVHTMAPAAHILYVGSPNNYSDMDASLNWIVANHAANIVTNSYGYGGEALPPGYIKPQNDIFIQGAAEGISMFFSSGDSGDQTGGVAGATPTPDWPASSPFVTAVGGTSMGVAADDSRIFELGWETGKSTLGDGPSWNPRFYTSGSGGGTSRLFRQPSYQAGVVPDSISKTYGGAAMRSVPDVSALGDPNTGMRIGQTQIQADGTADYSEYRIGGTSLSSPLYAGMFALAVQKSGHEYGLANPVLYGAAAYDITKADLAAYPGDTRVDFANFVDDSDGYLYSARWFDFDDNLTIHVRDGYDDVTGVGSPDGQAWLDAIASH